MPSIVTDKPAPSGGAWQRARIRTAELLDVPSPGDTLSRLVDVFIITLILVNIAAMMLETVEPFGDQWRREFNILERVSVCVFSVEYLLRVWSITDNRWRSEYHHPLWGRLRFMRSPMALIDLFVVLPFWLQVFLPLDLRFLRVLRLLRVLKLTRYSAATNLLFDVVKDKSRVMGAAIFILFLLLVVAATTMYFVENPAQPQAFANIPQSLWWAIVTVTTVGYGDVVPQTPLGKMIGSVLGFIGVAVVALPAGILASGFIDALEQRRDRLREALNDALSDGVVDSDEHRELHWHGHRLSLSRSQVERILAEGSRAAKQAAATQATAVQAAGAQVTAARFCPHCGKRLADDGAADDNAAAEMTAEELTAHEKSD